MSGIKVIYSKRNWKQFKGVF